MAILEADGFTPIQVSAYGNTVDLPNYVPPSAGSQSSVLIEVLDANLVRQGSIQFVNLTATLYYNAVGSWSMLVPYSDTLWNMMMSGDFIVSVNWRDLFTFGGKCEQPGYVDSLPGSTAGVGSFNGPFINLSGGDYLALIANKIAYPSPGAAWSGQTATASDPVSLVSLETAIKHYVNNNVGPGAIASRRNSLLDIATDQARGSAVSYTVKFGTGVDLNLLDIIRALITSSTSPMGISIKRNAATHRLTFDVYIPRDLSGKAWFSRSLGNLTAINFYITDPTITDSLVQGSGINFIQKTATAKTQWNQAETFTDSSSETDVNNLNATAVSTLGGGAAGPNMNATMTDTPFLTFGRDYGLGDIVSIEVRPGAVYSDVVSSVTLTADPTQTPMLSVVPTIGSSANATATDQTIIGQLTTRIQNLERILATK
jgi:hypothetical protein